MSHFLGLMVDDRLHYIGDDDGNDDDDEDDKRSQKHDERETQLYEGLYLHVQYLKLYRTELGFYRRAREHHVDGLDVPRFLSSMRVPPSYTWRYCHTECSSIRGIPCILMQYLPGFPLTELYNTPSPPPAHEDWKRIANDGLRTIQYNMQDLEALNRDQCLPRNTVVHWDPNSQKWKCKLIDFGHCEFRTTGTRKWEWSSNQSWLQEEDVFARYMETWFERKKGFQYVGERSQSMRSL